MQKINSIDNSKCKKRKCDKMQDSSPEILRVQPDSDVLNICDIDSPDTPIKADMFQSNACHEDLHRYSDSPCSDNHITDAFHNTPSVSSVVSGSEGKKFGVGFVIRNSTPILSSSCG